VLRRLSSLLDEAHGPLQRLDLPRVAELTRQQQELLDELGGSLPEPGSDGMDGSLVGDVRRKLLRNRVVAAHVLDFASQLQQRLGHKEADGYAPDGRATADGSVGRLIRTSV